MSRKSLKKIFMIVLILATLTFAVVTLYFVSQGFHYPCVRCVPWGGVWHTPTPPVFYKLEL